MQKYLKIILCIVFVAMLATCLYAISGMDCTDLLLLWAIVCASSGFVYWAQPT